MRNMLDGMDRGWKGEEQFGDLEDKVMETNQVEQKRKKKDHAKWE